MADEFDNFLNEPAPQIQKAEWVGIITFGLALILTLNMYISFLLTFLTFGGYSLIEYLIWKSKRNPKKFFKKMSKIGNILITIFIILYFLDGLLTYLSVWHFQFAYEMNLFVIFLWETFGYSFGELIRLALFSCAVFYPLWILNNSKNHKKIFVAFIFSLFSVLLWAYAVIHNLAVLIVYLSL